jgi:hypothetical protein
MKEIPALPLLFGRLGYGIRQLPVLAAGLHPL